MSQTSINAAGQPIGIAGMDYDSGDGKDVVSFFNTGSASIPFGCAVKQDTASGQEKGGKALSASGDKVIGINVYGLNHMPSGGGSGDVDSVGLMQNAGGQLGRRGRFLGPIAYGITIAPGDRAFALYTSDGDHNTTPGVFSNIQDGGTNYIDLTAVGVFRSPTFTANTATGGSASVAVLEVDFTNKP